MRNYSAILLTLLVAAIAAGFGPCKKGDFPVSEMARKAAVSAGVPVSREVRQVTPAGAVHFGKFALSTEQLALIDSGLNVLNASAIEDGFRPEAVKPHSFYEVLTPPYPCVPSPEQRIPSFMVNGGDFYDGTEYDQYNSRGPDTPHRDPDNGGWIVWKKDGKSAVFAAEYILSIGTPGSTYLVGMMYVCPDMSVIENAVRHGGDHIYLANFPYTEEHRLREPYDVWTWFNGSLFHGPPHPLLPRGGRFVSHFADTGDKLGPPPSVVTTIPVPADVREKFAGSIGDVVLVRSSSAIIGAVK